MDRKRETGQWKKITQNINMKWSGWWDKFADSTKKWWVVGLSEGCVAIQRAKRNLMKFKKWKQKALPSNKPMTWVATTLKTALQKRTSESCARSNMPWQQRGLMVSWAALGGILSAGQGMWFFLFLNIGEALPGVLCPVLGPLVQARQGHVGEIASLLWGKADRAGTVQPSRSLRWPYICKYLKR